MRCFYALDLPPTECARLAALGQALRGLGDLRWVAADRLHLTLVFLGELDAAAVTAAEAALAALPLPALQLQVTGLGSFPPRGAPRTLWAGLGGDVAALATVQQRLEAAAAGFGVAPERRPFRPHVTLARAKTPLASRLVSARWEAQAAAAPGAPFVPVAVTLYRSELTAAGPRYTALLRRPLVGPQR